MKQENDTFSGSETKKKLLKRKMEKQILLLAVAMIALLTVLTPAMAVVPNVVVSGFSISQGNASVGKDFVLSLTLTNTEPTACAQGITTSVQATFPFVLRGVTSVDAGDLCTGTTGGSSTVVDFPMKIDPTATGGSYQFTVANSFETPTLAQFTTTNVINLFVQGSPELNAYITNSNPLDIYPGDTASLTVSINNDGSFNAQAVTAKLSAEAPLSVVATNSLASVGMVNARQAKTAVFSVEIPKNAPAKDYSLHLAIQYLDENLEMQTKDSALTLHVKPIALFATTDAGSGILHPNQNTRTIKLLLKNTGTDTAYRIQSRIQPQYPFSTDGSTRYIDVLEPGKTSPIEFTVNVDKDATPGTYVLSMLINFEDNQGKSLQDTADVSLTVLKTSFFTAVFASYWFLWLALVVIIVLVVRRRRKKAAMKKKA